MPIGAVSDEPPETIEASLVDVTTEESVVGKAPGRAVPFVFTPGEPGAGVAPAEATTDESSVGISCGGLVEGRAPSRPSLGPDVTEGVPPFSRSDGAVGFAFSIAAC